MTPHARLRARLLATLGAVACAPVLEVPTPPELDVEGEPRGRPWKPDPAPYALDTLGDGDPCTPDFDAGVLEGATGPPPGTIRLCLDEPYGTDVCGAHDPTGPGPHEDPTGPLQARLEELMAPVCSGDVPDDAPCRVTGHDVDVPRCAPYPDPEGACCFTTAVEVGWVVGRPFRHGRTATVRRRPWSRA